MILAGASSIALIASSNVLASSCECPKPPGGSTECEGNQVAFCTVKDGVCKTSCSSIGSSKQSGEKLAASVLTEFLGQTVSEKDLRKPQFEVFVKQLSSTPIVLQTDDKKTVVGLPSWAEGKFLAIQPGLKREGA
jgi:hypothetical protein